MNEKDRVRLRQILLTHREGTELAKALDRFIITIRQEVWREVLQIANEHLNKPGFGYLLRNKLLEAAANSVPEDSEGEGNDS